MKKPITPSADFYQNLDLPSNRRPFRRAPKRSEMVVLEAVSVKGYLLKRLIFPAVILALTIILSLLSLSSVVSEFFAVTVSRYLAHLMACMGSVTEFPIFDILFMTLACALIVMFIAAIVLFCVKQPHIASFILIIILNVILCFIFIFQLSAGMIYNRKPIQDGMNIPYAQSNTITSDELYGAADYFIDELNKTSALLLRDNYGRMYNPNSFSAISSYSNIMLNEINRNFYLHSFSYRPKQLYTSDISSAFGIAGITMPLTGEIGVNRNTFDYTLPMTITHELAHSKGVMTENQANALAFNVCLRGGNEYKYSAYSTIARSLLSSIYRLDGIKPYGEYYNKISLEITAEWELYSDYLTKFDGFLTDVGDFFNDVYLKLNGVKSGTFNYSELDGYIIGIFRDIHAHNA